MDSKGRLQLAGDAYVRLRRLRQHFDDFLDAIQDVKLPALTVTRTEGGAIVMFCGQLFDVTLDYWPESEYAAMRLGSTVTTFWQNGSILEPGNPVTLQAAGVPLFCDLLAKAVFTLA